MSGIKNAVTALILVSLAVPAAAKTHKRHVTGTKQQIAAACHQQANAQKLHFAARYEFLRACMHRPKKR